MRRRPMGAVGCVVAALAIAACGSSSSGGSERGGPQTINGAGSTLAQPIYQQWSVNLRRHRLIVDYNGVGSGAGIADLQTGTIDFAGSDPAITPTDLDGMKGPVLQFPVAFGAITVSYNLPGIKSGLKLDGPTIAEIFSGKITRWNAAQIKKLNLGVSLPATAITVVHRSDSSGTTYGFTTYLSAVSSDWKSSIGFGKDVKWPVGTGAAKNGGVATAVRQTVGAVGYVEQAYALENHFTYAAIRNLTRRFVLPTIANTSAAAQGITVSPSLGVSTINSSAPGAYPIVSQTFLDVYRDPCRDDKEAGATARGLKTFLAYALGPGQLTLGDGSNALPYAPLPSSLAARDLSQLATMTCNGGPIR